jgi:hypothetical protein
MEERNETLNLFKEIRVLFKYWKYFLLSFCICIGLSVLYIVITKPVYQINAGVLIKNEDNKNSSPMASMLQGFSFGSSLSLGSSSVDDELLLLNSYTMIKKSIKHLKLNVNYFSNGFLTNYIYLELGLIAVLIAIVSNIYDKLYINTVEEIIDAELAGVVIGFSNKLLILTGEEVMDEIETDEIKIRSVSDDEEETFFSKYTTVLECFKNGELVGRVGVDRIAHLEGTTLKADMSRANEDMVVMYDDDDDDGGDSMEIEGIIEDLDSLDDLVNESGTQDPPDSEEKE